MPFKPTPPALAMLLAAACLCALPAHAASSASSASSNAASSTVGSVSASFERSSESSAGDRRAAAGDYRLVALTPAGGRAGTVRMQLQALADAAQPALVLLLPRQAADDSRLQPGDIVSVSERPHGLAFTRHDTQQLFFLVVADELLRELETRAVRL